MAKPRAISKRLLAKVEPVSGGQRGEFTALVSAFGNVDHYGDIVDAGAFAKSLADWETRSGKLPVIWSHQWDDPDSFIGGYIEANEIEQGLLMRGLLDVDDNPRAARVYDLMEKGYIDEFSFGGLATKYGDLERLDDGSLAQHITEIELWEAGPCFKGANPATELVSVKAMQRALADTQVEQLKQLLDELIAEGSPPGDPDDESTDDPGEDDDSVDPAEDETRGATLAPHVRALLELTTMTKGNS